MIFTYNDIYVLEILKFNIFLTRNLKLLESTINCLYIVIKKSPSSKLKDLKSIYSEYKFIFDFS